MVLTVNIANTIEYNEYKTGERNEGIIFSLRPFMAKMASALEQGIMTLVLVTSGIFVLSQNVSELERQKEIYDNLETAEQAEYKANAIAEIVIFEGEKYAELTAETKQTFYEMLQLVEYETEDGKEIMIITATADQYFRDRATSGMRIYLRLAITVVPAITIVASWLILRKKFIIDEEMYNMMISEIKFRKGTVKEAD
jgi:melibiose permease/lactose/raffinose/galactose permease